MQKHEELFDLANKTDNPDLVYTVLEQWLDDVTNNYDKLLLAARNEFYLVADRDTVCEGFNPHGQSKQTSRRTTSSMSSQRRHEFLIEKQERAATMRLAKQRHEIAMRKKLETQMEQIALQELEDDFRQRAAAAKLDEAELMDTRSLFSNHSSQLILLNNRGVASAQESQRNRYIKAWFSSFTPSWFFTGFD